MQAFQPSTWDYTYVQRPVQDEDVRASHCVVQCTVRLFFTTFMLYGQTTDSQENARIS